jgi:hypothetical protein
MPVTFWTRRFSGSTLSIVSPGWSEAPGRVERGRIEYQAGRQRPQSASYREAAIVHVRAICNSSSRCPSLLQQQLTLSFAYGSARPILTLFCEFPNFLG